MATTMRTTRATRAARATRMGPRALVAALLGLTLAVSARGTLRAQAPEDYKVIVNAANPVPALSAGEVSRLFLKKVTSWPGGRPVLPVDQTKGSPVRASFSRGVHGRNVAAVASYWQQMIFSGRGVPPLEESSESAVVTYVETHPNAIGYVSASAALPPGVRAVKLSR
jgi:ABC-type phosphate transport system substrate-binding protein